jgi:Na+/melibiose symporter-like transporter
MFALSATAYAIFAVPYTAMAAEMSDSSQERVRIMAYRMTLVMLGILAGSSLAPMLVGALGGGRHGYAGMSIMIGSVAAGAMLLAFFSTRGVQLLQLPVRHVTWREQARLVLRNRQFLCLLSVYLVQLLALGTMTAAAPYFAVHVLGQDERLIGRIFLVLLGVAVVSMPFWSAMARRHGKKRAYFAASLLYAAASLCCLLCGRWQPIVALRADCLYGARFRRPATAAICNADRRDQRGQQRLGSTSRGLAVGPLGGERKSGLAIGPLGPDSRSTRLDSSRAPAPRSCNRRAPRTESASHTRLSGSGDRTELALLRRYRSEGEQLVQVSTS